MCKVVEKIVNRRLQYIIESRRLHPEMQFGFRRNKSTTDVLITLENFIMDAIRKKEYTALLSLDISKHMTPVRDKEYSANSSSEK
jgi:hypothetical protein